jgi:ribosomal protein S12 methylthiotransferase
VDQPDRYYLCVLGCPKNQVDGGYLDGLLEASGFRATSSPDDADVCIVHTCGFIESAAQESIDTLLELAVLKRRNPDMRLVASGCLAQRHGADLAGAMPELDVVVGTRDWPRLPEVLRESGRRGQVVRIAELAPIDYSQLPFRPTGTATSYLKLSDGCSFRCAFCTIPSFTGNLRSKPVDVVLDEARRALDAGAAELVLVAQDLTGYGRDLVPRCSLAALLRRLGALEPAPRWIRLMYATLEGVSDELVETMATLDCVAKYIDMPLQHVHPATLRRMRRPYSADRALAVLARLREAIPELAVRSTFVVGFPGETEAEFAHLLDFLDAAELDWVTAFAYSEEPGTPAATMPDQVPVTVRHQRRRAVYAAQAPVSRRRNRRLLGKQITVLGEAVATARGSGGSVLMARSEREAPEVDGRVVVRGLADPGAFVDHFTRVRVTTAATYQVGAVAAESGHNTSARQAPLRLLRVNAGGRT